MQSVMVTEEERTSAGTCQCQGSSQTRFLSFEMEQLRRRNTFVRILVKSRGPFPHSELSQIEFILWNFAGKIGYHGHEKVQWWA